MRIKARRGVDSFVRPRAAVAGAAAVMFAAFVLGACAPRVDNQGHLPDPEILTKIEVGKQRREQVLDLIGSPSSVAAFGPETWYYISQRVHTVAFFAPTLEDRKVIAIRFDDKGVVRDVRELGLEDGKKVEHVERATPTAGHEMTVLEQVIGNLGRFNRRPGPNQPQAPNPTGPSPY